MPFYDYKCTACGNRIEVIHGVNDLGPGACDVCGGPMRKMLSSPSIVFKGSGWAKKERSTSAGSSKGTDKDDASTDKPAGDTASGGDTGKPDAGMEKKAADGKPASESTTGSGSGDAA
jgi:putative FmdB family regulatory protein